MPFYLWESPGKIAIELHFDVIDRMSPEVLRGLGALKRRGAEVGGLLLGRPEPGIIQRVTIEDFEPIPSEYLTGPSYNLSQRDLVAFEAAIARRRDDPDGLSVVGFYRSHTREDLYMDEADLGIARRYFPGGGNVFLLIKPFATRASIAGFFFWEDGEITRESSYLEFPFHRGELGGGEPRIVAGNNRGPQERPLPPYTPAPLSEPDPQLQSDDESWQAIRQANLSILNTPPEPAPRVQRRWLIAPAFLTLAVAAGYFGFQNLSSSRAPAPRPAATVAETTLPLKLSVAEKQEQLDVTWDRNAPALATAQRGLLSISDGSNRRELVLSGAQLRNGRVLYSRLSGDVALRLEVFPEGQESVSESIRIVSADPAPTLAIPRQPVQRSIIESKPEPTPEITPVPERREPPPVVRKTTPPPAPARRVMEARPKLPAPVPTPAAEQPEIELQRPARRR